MATEQTTKRAGTRDKKLEKRRSDMAAEAPSLEREARSLTLKPVPNAEFWFGRRKVWYVSGKDAETLKAAAEVVKASNSPISAGVGASGISMEQAPPAKSE